MKIKYGKTFLEFTPPPGLQIDQYSPQVFQGLVDVDVAIQEALEKPLNFNYQSFLNSQSVAIAINDKTRPVPHHIILPPLLRKLEELGVKKRDVSFIIAVGTHTPMPREEFPLVLPHWIVEQYHICSHNCDDEQNLMYLGASERGTEIVVNKQFVSSEFRLVVGNIEPHHFMGFSGGVKSAAIGLGSRRTITQNHSLLLDERSCIGEFETNPMRQEVEEIGEAMGVHFALNVILNSEKEICGVFSGNPRSVMEEGIKLVNDISQIPVPHYYDLVIASAGGYPKDINLYQAQKALTNAARIVKEGGTIILVAECIEGIGSKGFENFMEGLTTWQDVIEKFRSIGFQVGPHKAMQIANIARKAKIILISSMDAAVVNKFLMYPAKDIDEALQMCEGTVTNAAFLPLAVTTIPRVMSQNLDCNSKA